MNKANLDRRDRGALIFNGYLHENGYRVPVSVEAEEDGLLVDDYLTIPWEWVDRARQLISSRSHKPLG